MAIFNKEEDYKIDPIAGEIQEIEEKMPSFKELVDQLNGRDELGKAYATAYISMYFKDFENLDDEFEPIEELSFVGPVFDVSAVPTTSGDGAFVKANITFGNDNIKDIVALYRLLEKFEEERIKIKDDDTVLPVLSILLKPNKKTENNEHKPIYFLEMMMPFFWTTSGEFPGRSCNRIELLFEVQYCNIIRNLLTMDVTREIVNQEQIKARAKAEDERLAEEEAMKKQNSFYEDMQDKIQGSMTHAEAGEEVLRVGRDAKKETD